MDYVSSRLRSVGRLNEYLKELRTYTRSSQFLKNGFNSCQAIDSFGNVVDMMRRGCYKISGTTWYRFKKQDSVFRQVVTVSCSAKGGRA